MPCEHNTTQQSNFIISTKIRTMADWMTSYIANSPVSNKCHHKPRWGTCCLRAHSTTWWIFFSHIPWKLKSTKLAWCICFWYVLHWMYIWSEIVAYLLLQTTVPRYLWSTTVLSIVGGYTFHLVFPEHTWLHKLRDVKCPQNFRNGILYLCDAHYHDLFKFQ